MAAEAIGTVGLVWRGNREMREKASAQGHRLSPTFDALAAVGLTAQPAVYLDEMIDDVREQLLRVDGVLVWVDPVAEGGTRSNLDPLLRELSDRGIWVSAHPDTILKMGTKEVLYRTKSLGWGSDCHLYESIDRLREQLPRRLASGSTRVLKQYRGNGGVGVYRVALLPSNAASSDGAATAMDALVETQHARRGSVPAQMSLGDFMRRMEKHFTGDGRMIDQPFQERLADGMTRCYMVHNKVVGFAHQLIKALLPPPPQGIDSPEAQPGPRIMHGAGAPAFQPLRNKLEFEWIPGLQQLLEIPTSRLPAIWDADFLYGPKTAAGEDTYVLCEINVSAVLPFPDEALAPLARAVATAVASAKAARGR
jgi:hypothetical protein